jgi:intracellular septation protein A
LAGVTLDWERDEWGEWDLDSLQALRREPVRRSWKRRHAASIVVLASTLVVVGAAMAWNLQGYPGRVNDDEGTYMSRAWGMLYEHHLSNYTYFWDHPFLGWASIAVWGRLTDGFGLAEYSLTVGRDFMWVVCLITAALVFLLARRLGMSRVAAVVAVLLFGLSPLGIWYHRLVFLDYLATAWAVGAFAAAASRRRGLGSVLGSAICFAAATWSKETVALLVPALAWLLAQHATPRQRKKYLLVFGVVYVGLVGLWPLLAAVKGEILPGSGHVSMLGEAYTQLVTRQATGSLLSHGSVTSEQVNMWLRMDSWLGYGTLAAAGCALLTRKCRPLALIIVVQVLYMMKGGGYVPYAFVTVMIPFGALLLAGVPDTLWRAGIGRGRTLSRGAAWRWTPRIPVLAAAVVLAVTITPRWYGSLRASASVNGFADQDSAVAWVAQHVPPGNTVVCDDYPWLDIKLRTSATPLSLWQVDNDPSVMKSLLPRGYKDIAYMVLEPNSPVMTNSLPGRPTLRQALAHAVVVKRFGPINIYQVRSDLSPAAAARESRKLAEAVSRSRVSSPGR